MTRNKELKPTAMTAAQLECYRLWCDFRFGENHVVEMFIGWNLGILCIMPGSGWALASYDYNELTRLVVLAHDRGIRVEVRTHGTKLAVALNKRERNTGSMMTQHPELDAHVTQIRKDFDQRGPCHVYGVDP